MTTPIIGAAAEYGAGKARQAGRDLGRARVPTGNRQYQGVILAEFLVAILIVSVAPLARGKGAQDTTTGPSPYGVDDIKQLAGIGAVYFVLALLSSGKYGRLSAWFGGLVLVAIGLAETTSGGLPAIFGIFQPGSTSSGSSDTPSDQFPGLAQAAANAAVGVGQRAAANQVVPSQTGAPIFGQQVIEGGAVTTTYQGGPGVVTSDQGISAL